MEEFEADAEMGWEQMTAESEDVGVYTEKSARIEYHAWYRVRSRAGSPEVRCSATYTDHALRSTAEPLLRALHRQGRREATRAGIGVLLS